MVKFIKKPPNALRVEKAPRSWGWAKFTMRPDFGKRKRWSLTFAFPQAVHPFCQKTGKFPS
jgi:hypothetical protein